MQCTVDFHPSEERLTPLKGIKPGDNIARTEEAACVWLWWRPQFFLEWKKPVHPIFCPPSRDLKGDLWAIDDDGYLLLIENKRDTDRDPFIKFVDVVEALKRGNTKKLGDQKQSTLSLIKDVGPLQERWERALSFERTYIDHATGLYRDEAARMLKDSPKGVLPYSCGRLDLKRWSLLTREICLTLHRKDSQGRVEYEVRARRAFRKREQLLSRMPAIETVAFFGVYVLGLRQKMCKVKALDGTALQNALSVKRLVDQNRFRHFRSAAVVESMDPKRTRIVFERDTSIQ